MNRDLDRLSSTKFDVLVIGGGILGAFATWQAARRGLSVALVERNDFGSGTTAGSGKILHGGLRHLQHGDLRSAVESLREQARIAALAPDLVRCLPFVVPPRADSALDGLLLRTAAVVWRWIPRLVGERARLPDPQFVRGAAVAEDLWGSGGEPGQGALRYHDLQVRSPERLTLAVVKAAHEDGAAVANHAEALRFLSIGERDRGAEVRDRLGGDRFEVRARLILNAAGPWTPSLVGGGARPFPSVAFGRGIHLVADLEEPPCALALPWRDAEVSEPRRRIFVTPWEGLTLIGAAYAGYGGHLDEIAPISVEVDRFVERFSAAWPEFGLERSRVRFAYAGLYPIFGRARSSARSFTASRSPLIVDHDVRGGSGGVISVMSVKLTTARALASEAVRLAVARLAGDDARDDDVEGVTLSGARMWPTEIPPEQDFLQSEDESSLEGLVGRAVDEEMARTMGDFVLRRIPVGHRGHPGARALEKIGRAMGRRLGWTSTQTAEQILSLERVYRSRGLFPRSGGDGGPSGTTDEPGGDSV